jgi:hypothetical protein
MGTPWTRIAGRVNTAARHEAKRSPVDRDHPYARLTDLLTLRDVVENELDEHIIAARDRSSCSWDTLGGLLGMSRQGAQHRWRIAMERTGRAEYVGRRARTMGELDVKQD